MTGLLANLKLYSAITTAGYCLSKAKSIGTEDGYCWTATLCFGKKQLVTVSNGGFGGPDEFHYKCDPLKKSFKDITNDLKVFSSVPLVDAYIKDHLISMQEMSWQFNRVTKDQFEQAKLAITEKTPPINEEIVGFIVDSLRSSKEELDKLKRSLKTKIAWFKKGCEDGNTYVTLKWEDTPEHREYLLNKYPEISIFINDVIKEM